MPQKYSPNMPMIPMRSSIQSLSVFLGRSFQVFDVIACVDVGDAVISDYRIQDSSDANRRLIRST